MNNPEYIDYIYIYINSLFRGQTLVQSNVHHNLKGVPYNSTTIFVICLLLFCLAERYTTLYLVEAIYS
jgi:hypothetical protein